MGRKPTTNDKRLSCKLTTHVTEKRYRQLEGILQKSPNMDMSMLVRYILENRRVKIYVHDETLDHWMEELSRLRGEIRAIGVNINQITRHFNTYPEHIQKITYASMAFEDYQKIQPHIEAIWQVMKKLSDKWLSE